jgi:hypothetical protein
MLHSRGRAIANRVCSCAPHADNPVLGSADDQANYQTAAQIGGNARVLDVEAGSLTVTALPGGTTPDR